MWISTHSPSRCLVEAGLTSTGPDSGIFLPELHVPQPSVRVERAQLASFSSFPTTEAVCATSGPHRWGCVSPGGSERPSQSRAHRGHDPGAQCHARHSPQVLGFYPFQSPGGYVGGSVQVCECEWALSSVFISCISLPFWLR